MDVGIDIENAGIIVPPQPGDGDRGIVIYAKAGPFLAKLWDYIACLYPEGNIDPNQSYLFDHSQIETVFFTGYQDMEEVAYNQVLQEYRDKIVAHK
ncbi:DUF4176 domain-containing protein [Paenibacillus thiaminolyticus]|uniref:DUF4176 domain-containing protein n=1 Tax=Paenibacillus thiaminolyticus TaxID=49283 RepID=UPI0035A5AD66